MPATKGVVTPLRRVEKKAATRQHLIDATVDEIAVSGFADLTLSKISRRARVSRGLVNFHFTSKEQLLVETLRFLTEEYREFWHKAIAKPKTPAERLLALVRADFHPKVCNRKKIAVFYAFWGEAKSRPTYLEVSATADREFAVTLSDLCAQIVEDGGYDIDPAPVAKGLRSMIDGLWLELLLSPQQFRRDVAMDICARYLAGVFPRHFTGNELIGAIAETAT
mgnify:CR=1 FL=1